MVNTQHFLSLEVKSNNTIDESLAASAALQAPAQYADDPDPAADEPPVAGIIPYPAADEPPIAGIVPDQVAHEPPVGIIPDPAAADEPPAAGIIPDPAAMNHPFPWPQIYQQHERPLPLFHIQRIMEQLAFHPFATLLHAPLATSLHAPFATHLQAVFATFLSVPPPFCSYPPPPPPPHMSRYPLPHQLLFTCHAITFLPIQVCMGRGEYEKCESNSKRSGRNLNGP